MSRQFTFNDPVKGMFFDMNISDDFTDKEVEVLFEETVKQLLIDLKKSYTEKEEKDVRE